MNLKTLGENELFLLQASSYGVTWWGRWYWNRDL